jgi:hypothetical protein
MSEPLPTKVSDRTLHNAQEDIQPPITSERTTQYITGLKLWLVVAAVTLVTFLILLDMSIIVTVC